MARLPVTRFPTLPATVEPQEGGVVTLGGCRDSREVMAGSVCLGLLAAWCRPSLALSGLLFLSGQGERGGPLAGISRRLGGSQL